MSKLQYRQRKFSALLAVAALLFFAGCHHPYNAVPELHPEPWTLSEIENTFGGSDPLEGFNRSMFSCTDFAMNYIADPLGRVYSSIFPRFFIEHLHNVCLNLEFPARFFSCLLQAKWQGAGDEGIRFLANSTLGIAGIFDVAWHWWKIPSTNSGFADTFARWGIGPGETFMLPFVPAVSGRDITGLLFDTAFDGKTYIPYAGSATALNRMVMMHSNYTSITNDAIDPYKNFRQMMLLNNELKQQMWFYCAIKSQIRNAMTQKPIPAKPETFPKPPELQGEWLDLHYYLSQDTVNDTLRMMLFRAQKDHDPWYMRLSIFNSDFAKHASIRKIRLLQDRDKIRYSYYEAPETKDAAPRKERLVLLLPGIGGTCTTANLTALAEVFHNAGCKVAGFDSTFNWRFISADSQCRLPGFLPDDAERVRRVLKKALDDLKADKKINNPEIILAGYSLGGIQTLKIAELESAGAHIGISRYLAINPPVSLHNAMNKIDSLAASSASWTKSEMRKRLTDTAGKLMMLSAKKIRHFDMSSPEAPLSALAYPVGLDKESAGFVAGIFLKMSLRDIMLAAHREKPLPGLPEYKWGRRNKLYLALDKTTLAGYAEKFLLPNYEKQTLAELFQKSDLRSFEKFLKNAPNVRIIHSYDDFLLTPSDRQWLDSTMGKRLLWLSRGGHLGNLYYLPVIEAIKAAAL